MRPGSVFVMCSTVDPNVSIGFERRLEALGLLYVDAPISGGAAKAASGQMTVMGAARDAAWAKAEPCLNAMAAKVYRLGDRAGNGSKVKIINQLLAGVHIAAAAEAMALGLREGVDAAALYDVITHSAGNSWMFENRMAHVLANDYTPLSAVDIFVKDLGLVLDTARATKFPLPLASTAHQMFMQASTAGFAKEDDAAVIKIFPGIELPGASDDDSGSAASPTTSPAPPTSPTTWSAPACGWCSQSACPRPARRRWMRTSTRSSSPSSRAPSPRPTRWRSRSRPAGCCEAGGATQIYFKVCSTFDSTPRGNIGPVLEALMDALDCRLHDRHAGVPGQRPHRLQGPPVRRRRAALGKRHAQPSADADDRCQPGARAAGAAGDDARPGRFAAARRPGRPSHGRRLERGDRRALQGARSKAAWRSRSPMPSPTTTCCASAPRSRICRWSAPAPAWRSACRANFGLSASSESASLPPVTGFRAIVSGSCSEATNGQVAHFLQSGGAARQVDALALDGVGRCAGREHRAPGRARSGRRRRSARCSSTAPPRRKRSRRRRRRAAATTSARASSGSSPRWRAGWSRTARGGWWSPAARPRVRACRRSASRGCASAPRSTPACPGAMPRRRSPPKACTWR